MSKGALSVANGHAWRDEVCRYLRLWLKTEHGVKKECADVFEDICGSQTRADILLSPGLLRPPFDGIVVVEAKFQGGTGTAHERIWKDYINALMRSPYATLFVCEGEWYEPFVNWASSHEAKTLTRVVGRMEIDAVIGTNGLLQWFKLHEKSWFD